jgi:D-alanyl-D-alanine carboxypeptidase/D-alanyl-D-alanine-endopeptidase (penicillin-binding protein 4)
MTPCARRVSAPAAQAQEWYSGRRGYADPPPGSPNLRCRRRPFSATSLLALAILVILAVPAAPCPAADAQPNPAALRQDLEAVIAGADLGKATVAVRVVDLGDPAAPSHPVELYSRLPDLPLVPASNMKLVVTAACFDRFGPDWRIRTHVGRVPSPRGNDTWDLAVIGGGDPNLSGRFWGGDTVGAFRRWAAVLKGRGITSLERVVLDDTLFEARLVHPNWPANQREKWYEAPVNALPINDNCVNVWVAPGPAGGPARVRLEPPGSGIALSGTIRTVTAKGGHRYSIDRFIDPDGSMRIHVDGGFWAQAPERVEYRALSDPTSVFGHALMHALRAEGIDVAGPVVRAGLTTPRGAARRGFRCDLIHTSRLGATVAVANTRSQGLYAECLLKLLGAYGQTVEVRTPKPPRQGSWESGRQELARWLAERGIPAAGCVFDDGSGLSKENRLTVFTLTQILATMHRLHGARFRDTLAEAGEPDGTLRRRMRNTAADGRIFAKTGYVLGASSLSGYALSDSGRLLAFSILVGGFPHGHLWKAQLAQDKMCIRMATY